MARFPSPGADFGAYHVERQLGRGGMGVVFAATERSLQRTVALKVLPPELAVQDEFRQRFSREATILASLDSPHIVSILAHGEEDGCLYIATQHVAGGDLSAAIAAHGPVPLPIAAQMLSQLADALHDAHSAGVVHRDVKPSNVLLRRVSDDPFVYLCDFGIAQNRAPGFTATGAVAGTFAYLAPERCEGHPATPAADIYSLGCLWWAVLTGRTPYQGTDIQMARAHLSEPVPQFAVNSPAAEQVNRIVRRSMAKDPAERYASAAEMREELRDLVQHVRTSPAPPLLAPPVADQPATMVRPSSPSSPSSPSTPSTPPVGPPTVIPSGYPPSTPGYPAHPGAVGPSRQGRSKVPWIVGAAAGVAVAVVVGVVGAVALSGNDDPGRASGGDPTTESSSPDPSSSVPTTEPTVEPTTTSPPPPPEPKKPKPVYPDVPASTGPQVTVGQATIKAPAGWSVITEGTLANKGARDFSDFEGFYSSVIIYRSKPLIAVKDNLPLLTTLAETSARNYADQVDDTELLRFEKLPAGWLDGRQAVRVRAAYQDTAQNLASIHETWWVPRGESLYQVLFVSSRVDTFAERRAMIDPMTVSFRWK